MKEAKAIYEKDTKENWAQFVNGLELNVQYKMPDWSRYEHVRLTTEHDGYSWVMTRNYSVTGSTGYIFPMKNANYVKHFKTEKGARKNLINHRTIFQDAEA